MARICLSAAFGDVPRFSPTALDLYGATYILSDEMELIPFRHKGLRQLHADDNVKSVPAATADKLRKLLFTLEPANDLSQVSRFPGWKLHPLKGDLKEFWSVTVTGNWRLIFRYDDEAKSMDHLLRMQLAYDVARTRQRASDITIERYAPA